MAFGTVEGCIISRMDEHTNPNLDYVTVFGAQVRKSGPSKVLRYRLDTAIDYLNENPGTICIVSGGKGPNEPHQRTHLSRFLYQGSANNGFGIDAQTADDRISIENMAFNNVGVAIRLRGADAARISGSWIAETTSAAN